MEEKDIPRICQSRSATWCDISYVHGGKCSNTSVILQNWCVHSAIDVGLPPLSVSPFHSFKVVMANTISSLSWQEYFFL